MCFEHLIAIVLYLIVSVITIRIFCWLTAGWNKSNVCMIGKTVIITGGRTGLGYQTALIMASRGARVILADRKDSSEARKAIIKETNNPNVTGKYVDLTDLESIRRFAEEIYKEEERLDVLINNAGIIGRIKGYTKDGLPIQMQTNHLGPFLLSHLLVGILKKSAPSRIIFVSSSSAYTNFLTLDSLTGQPKNESCWEGYVQYSSTKLCNAISAVGFAERLKGTGVTCNTLHPGIVTTQMLETAVSGVESKFTTMVWYALAKIVRKVMRVSVIFLQKPYEGAQTQAYLAMANEVKNVTGHFFVDCKPFIRPLMIRNKKFCDEVWRKSEVLVKLRPDEKM